MSKLLVQVRHHMDLGLDRRKQQLRALRRRLSLDKRTTCCDFLWFGGGVEALLG